MPAAEADIREALTLYLADELETVKPGLRTERRFRALRRMTRDRRIDVMGPDLYYLEVIPAGDMGLGDRGPAQAFRTREYPYVVTLYHAFEDADAYGSASQSTWDRIAQAMIEAVAQGTFLPPDAAAYTGRVDIIGTPSLTLDVVPMGSNARDACHVIRATLRLSDQP